MIYTGMSPKKLKNMKTAGITLFCINIAIFNVFTLTQHLEKLINTVPRKSGARIAES